MLQIPKLIIFSLWIIFAASFEGAAEKINIDTLDISEKAKALLKKEQKHWCDPIAEGVNTFSFEGNPVTSVILGMDGENAIALIVNGYAKDVLKQLPMEFSVEAQKLLSLTLEGSVG